MPRWHCQPLAVASVKDTIPSDAVDYVIISIIMVAAFFAFGGAVAFRIKKRLLPRGFIVAEVLLGVVGAFVLFMFYGVIMHSIID